VNLNVFTWKARNKIQPGTVEIRSITIKASPGRKFSRLHLNNPGVVGHLVIPATWEVLGKSITVWGYPQAKKKKRKPEDPAYKITKTKKDWEYDSSGKNTCLAITRPWIQIPVLPEEEEELGLTFSLCKKIAFINIAVIKNRTAIWSGNTPLRDIPKGICWVTVKTPAHSCLLQHYSQ
jgi:hypothetical protein